MRDATRIVILLDRSGSMEVCRESTIAGINTFIRKQKETPGEATVRLAQFDDNAGKLDYQVTFDLPIKEVKELTQKDFQPRGSTPLLDAQGKTIDDLGAELAALPENSRPSRVIVVIITDGYENASHKFGSAQIREMTEHQRSKYNWDFVYLGANQDAVMVGQSLGALGGKSMTYNAQNAQAVYATYDSVSDYVTRGRIANTMNDFLSNSFTKKERTSSLTPDDGLDHDHAQGNA